MGACFSYPDRISYNAGASPACESSVLAAFDAAVPDCSPGATEAVLDTTADTDISATALENVSHAASTESSSSSKRKQRWRKDVESADATCADRQPIPDAAASEDLLARETSSSEEKSGEENKDPAEWAVLAEFRTFVKPTLFPEVTAFCTHLTGVTQADCDAAPEFEEAFRRWQAWLAACTGGRTDEILVVTCGDWDLRYLMALALHICKYNL